VGANYSVLAQATNEPRAAADERWWGGGWTRNFEDTELVVELWGLVGIARYPPGNVSVAAQLFIYGSYMRGKSLQAIARSFIMTT